MNYTFLYKVRFSFDGETPAECGIVYGKTFSEATARLEEFYGKDLETIELLDLYDTSLFTFDTSHFDTIKSILMEGF